MSTTNARKTISRICSSGGYDRDFSVLINYIHLLNLCGSLLLILLVDTVAVNPKILEAEIPCNRDRILDGVREVAREEIQMIVLAGVF
jgi:hypothetical protein